MDDRQAQILALANAAESAMERAESRHRHARKLDRKVADRVCMAHVAAYIADLDPNAFELALSLLRDAVRAAEDFSPREPS